MAARIAIDLGTSTMLVHASGRGVVFAEPSVVALGADERPIAVGAEARSMLGRAPDSMSVIEPLTHGVIDDADGAAHLLRAGIGAARGRSPRGADVVVSCTLGITGIERRSVEEAARAAGARRVVLVEEPLAAAIGAGLPVAEPLGSMVADLGGGASEAAIVSLGGVVHFESARVGGRHLDRAIVGYLRRRRDLAVGLASAEDLKIELSSATAREGAAEIGGLDTRTGLPRRAVVEAGEIAEAVAEPLDQIVGTVRRCLERAPAELAVDIIDNGVMLTGGGSEIHGIADRLREEMQVPCHVAEEPRACVMRGASLVRDEMEGSRGPLLGRG